MGNGPRKWGKMTFREMGRGIRVGGEKGEKWGPMPVVRQKIANFISFHNVYRCG